MHVRPEALAARMKDLFAAAVHYKTSRGIHGAALADADGLLIVAEDVGRHNAVDKVKGEALLRAIPTEDRILLSTGRISSEMLLKAARMGVPIVASRTSPTEMAVALAEQLNVTICGYVRGDSLNLYSGEHLVLSDGVGVAAPDTR
jgi:FdhD protein